jgi:D-alanyl-D-alanine carboxypeptidase
MLPRPIRLVLPVGALCAIGALIVPAAGQAKTSDATIQRGLRRLVNATSGPPGAVATLYRDGKLTTLRAGRANVRRPGAPNAAQHMRIASIAKAFSGAVALNLVQAGKLGLDDTLGQRLPSAPQAWAGVTIRQMLQHTSGIPDYTTSDAFREAATKNPRAYVTPEQVVGYVSDDPLAFTPGSRYAYSNTDNILIGLIAQTVTGTPYGTLLKQIVFQPAGLTQTSFPARRITLPSPFIRGYVVDEKGDDVDVTTFLSPSGAWASGAIVSTPADLAAFIRADLGLKFFGAAQQQEQMTWVRGSSSPAGPGRNDAGLALFRYTTSCGVVYGHTGNFPGYTQWAAATADGSRSVTTTLNIPAPTGRLLRELRDVQSKAVCALLGK